MNFINQIKLKFHQLDTIDAQQQQLKLTLNKLQEAIGRVENRQLDNFRDKSIADSEFRAFSQWGEDGIIQFLIRNVPINRKIFVEFGVQNYTESNTRFLLINNNIRREISMD